MTEEMRISVPIKNIPKFKEVFLYILNKVGAKPNVGKTVLFKLLYFIDFDYYELYEEQLMGLEYIKNKYGPTPVDFDKLCQQMIDAGDLEEVNSTYFHKQTKYLPHRAADISQLSAREMKVIDDTLRKYSDWSAERLSSFSHRDVPWIGAKEKEPISYESVFYRTPETSVRGYDDL